VAEHEDRGEWFWAWRFADRGPRQTVQDDGDEVAPDKGEAGAAA